MFGYDFTPGQPYSGKHGKLDDKPGILSSAKSALNNYYSGSAYGRTAQNRIYDAMMNGTGSYRDIDNALSAGGHDGNGSPQSTGSLVDGSPLKLKPRPRPPARHGSSGGSSAKQTWSYYEAPIAEYYGFGKETAYQEALANTAYRREMTDMKKAGLNPSVIYGAHNSSGADSSIIPRSSSGGGGGGSRRVYGKVAKKGISKTAYYGIQLASTGIGAMLGGRGGAWIGASVGRTAAQLIGSLF